MPRIPAADSDFVLKHRIAGALILITFGVIVLPLVLSGQGPVAEDTAVEPVSDEVETKVFVSKITPITGTTPVVTREPETKTRQPGAEPSRAPAPAEPMATAGRPAAPRPKEKPAPTSTPKATKSTTTAEKTVQAAAAIERGWIVRIGTFSKPENADGMMRSLKKYGFRPSSEQVKTSRGMATRVSVGPFAHRVDAARARSRIQQTVGEKGLISPYP